MRLLCSVVDRWSLSIRVQLSTDDIEEQSGESKEVFQHALLIPTVAKAGSQS